MRFIRYFLVSILFLVMGMIYAREIPKLKTWLIQKIQITTRENVDAEVKAKDIEFNFFPPGIRLKEIQVRPKGNLASTLSLTTLHALEIYLSPTSLLAGRFEVGNITLVQPSGNIFIRKEKTEESKNKGGNSNEDISWNQIMSLPLKSVRIVNGDIRVRFTDADLAFQLQKFNLKILKNFQTARIEFFGPEIMIKKPSIPESLTRIGISTRVLVEKTAMEIAAIKISQGENFVIARGVAQGEINKLTWSMFNGRTLANLDLAELRSLVTNLYPDLKVPTMSGKLSFQGAAKQQRGKEPLVVAEIESRDIKVAKFLLGNIRTKLKYNSTSVTAEDIRVVSSAGAARFHAVDVKLGKSIRASARLIVENLELRQLLANLGVGETPLHLDFTGRIPCEGTITPQVSIDCGGELDAANFRVHTTPENKTIVALKNFKVVGNMTIDKNKITFPKGMIAIGNSQGEAKGEVDYEKGFNFSYHTDRLDFSDIESLADLKYQGAVEVTGTTTGTADWGIIDNTIKMKDFWFEDYAMGTGQLHAHYEKGYLLLSDADAQLGNTVYKGKTNIKLTEPSGITAHLESSRMDLKDLVQVFSRKVTLPFPAQGVGTATLDVSGPFVFSNLTYKMKSLFKDISVAGETFREAHYNVHAVKGHVWADDVQFKKGEGLFTLTGDVLNNGNMNVNIAGRNLRVSDFEHMRTFFSGLDGHLSTDITMRDYILRPSVSIAGDVDQTTINQEVMEDSNFVMTINPNSFSVNAQIFAQRIKAALTYPFSEKGPFSLKFDTTDWDFSNLLGFVGKGTNLHDYETNLTAKVDLYSPQGGLWQSKGQVSIPSFYVRRGNLQMKNTHPVLVKFDNGIVTLDRMQIEGDNTQLTLTGARNKNDVLNFNINGRIDLSLLTFLTPFFKDMTGQLSLSTQVGGTTSRPDLLGSAFVSKGYFKLQEFPHPFEDINADFLFSQSRAILNRFSGRLGGGKLTANGSIQFKSAKDIPVDLSGDLTKTALSVPEGLATKGDLSYTITGNWFPYLLKADYFIDSGLYTKKLWNR